MVGCPQTRAEAPRRSAVAGAGCRAWRSSPSSVVAGAHTARRLLLAGVERARAARRRCGRRRTPAGTRSPPPTRTTPGNGRSSVRACCRATARLGGWAAAYLQGASQLDGSTADPDRFEPVLLCMPRRCQRQWWPGLRPFRSELDADDVVVVDGVARHLARCAPPSTSAASRRPTPRRSSRSTPLRAGLGVDLREVWRRTPGPRPRLAGHAPAATRPAAGRPAVALGAGEQVPRALAGRGGAPATAVELARPRRRTGSCSARSTCSTSRPASSASTTARTTPPPTSAAVDNARHEVLERHGLRVVRLAGGDLTSGRRRTVLAAPRCPVATGCVGTAPSTAGSPTPCPPSVDDLARHAGASRVRFTLAAGDWVGRDDVEPGGGRLQGRVEQVEVRRAGDLDHAEGRQVRGAPLHVEQPARVAVGRQQPDQADQRHLRRVGLAVEHRLPGEQPADGHAVQPADQVAVAPGLDAVGQAELGAAGGRRARPSRVIQRPSREGSAQAATTSVEGGVDPHLEPRQRPAQRPADPQARRAAGRRAGPATTSRPGRCPAGRGPSGTGRWRRPPAACPATGRPRCRPGPPPARRRRAAARTRRRPRGSTTPARSSPRHGQGRRVTRWSPTSAAASSP